jgi:hypothetical protein
VDGAGADGLHDDAAWVLGQWNRRTGGQGTGDGFGFQADGGEDEEFCRIDAVIIQASGSFGIPQL